MGSGGVRSAAVGRDGRVWAASTMATTTTTNTDGASTHSASELWAAVSRTVREVVDSTAGVVDAVCLAGTAHALMTGPPDAADDDVVLWSDRRSRSAHLALRESGYFRDYASTTGCPPHSAYWPARIAWLREIDRLGPQRPWLYGDKDWVFHRLTGEFLTDTSTAAATGLLDLDRLEWSRELVARLGADWLRTAPVRAATHVAPLSRAAAKATGLQPGTPVVLGGVDGPLAHLGVGGTDPRVASLTIGTSLGLRRFSHARPAPRDGTLWSYPLAADIWVSGGAGSNGGNVLAWVESALLGQPGDTATVLRRVLERPPDPDLVFLPYLHGERAPLWDDNLSGGVVGLRPHHDAWDIARAALDAIACMAHDLGRVVRDLTGPFAFVGLNGGFTASQEWCRLVVDAVGAPGASLLHDLAVIHGAAHVARAALNGGSITAARAETGPAIHPDPDASVRIREASARLAAVRGGLWPAARHPPD